ncbi:MAG: class I SAM-dependent DNA methyltransferase, partial [Desulfurococcus sp.]
MDYRDGDIILTHNPGTRQPLTRIELQQKYPGVYGYLYQFKEDLKSRSIKPFLSLRDAIRKAKSEAEKQWASSRLEEIFYIVDNIGSYTFAPYKVAWKEVSARMGAGGFHVAVVGSLNDKYLGSRVVVPNHTVVIVPMNNETEAHYLSAVLNSSIIAFVGTYMPVKGLENLAIPKFNQNNSVHVKLAELSMRAHELAKCIYAKVKPDYCGKLRNPEEELAKVEEEIDRLVAELYGMPEDALQDIRGLLAILKAEEAPEESEVEDEVLKPSIEFLKTDVVAGQRDYIEFNVVTVEECDKARIILQGPWGVKDLGLGEGRHKLEVVLPEG